MKNLFKRGFTLIELLVVIAIIGILASIVITNLGSARNKAKNSSAQVSMASMKAEAELSTNSSGNYPEAICAAGVPGGPLATLSAAVLSSSGVAPICTSATAVGGFTSSWAVSVALPAPAATFCVDSSGFSGSDKTALGGGAAAASCQ